MVATTTDDVVHALRLPEARRTTIGHAAEARTLRAPTADTRAQELESFLAEEVREAAELAAD